MNAARGLANRMSQFTGGLTALAVAGGLGYGVYESVYNVEPGHRGIMFSRLVGVKDDVVSEGLHVRVPWLEYPSIYDIRTQAHMFSSPTGTKDLQMVNISLRVLSRPNPERLPTIHRELGPEYHEKVLPSVVNEVLKSVVARFNANMLITQREGVSSNIREALKARVGNFGLILDDVSITDLTFGHEYAAAVEAKQIAQQNAQRAALIVEQARQQKMQKIVEAEGEAQSAALIGKAVAENPGFLNLRKIEAAREIATIVSTSANRVYLNADNLLLDVTQSLDDSSLKKNKENPKKGGW